MGSETMNSRRRPDRREYRGGDANVGADVKNDWGRRQQAGNAVKEIIRMSSNGVEIWVTWSAEECDAAPRNIQALLTGIRGLLIGRARLLSEELKHLLGPHIRAERKSLGRRARGSGVGKV